MEMTASLNIFIHNKQGRIMKMNRIVLLLSALACFAVASCGPKEVVEDKAPKVLKISPASKSSESGLAHDVSFTVVCDGEFELSLTDGSWASVTGQKKGSSDDAVDITIHLTDNLGNENRTETVKVTAGKLEATATITQRPVGQLLPAESIELVNTVAVEQSWKLPANWTAKCYNNDGTPADWFSVTPDSGIINIPAIVSIKANAVNLGSAPRKGYIEVTIATIKARMDVNQAEADFGKETYGVFNYDGANSSLVYEPIKMQYSLKKGTGYIFRVVSPKENKFFIISVDESEIVLSQNWTEVIPLSDKYQVTLLKTDTEKNWFVTDGGMCFVIPK